MPSLSAQNPVYILSQQLARLAALLLITTLLSSLCRAQDSANSQTRWWKGNLHTHSLWSDGDDFPEMIARWYRERDYNFLALSDHNILSRGERWMKLADIERRGGPEVLPKYIAAMGDDWVQTRANSPNGPEVRLTPLEEFRGRFEAAGEFLMIEGEEISDSVNTIPVHMNATNLAQLLPPVGGATVREAMANNLRAAEQQMRVEQREILVHLNHPNYGWAVTAEDIAAVTQEQFIEVYNGHPGVNHPGDATRASVEEIWDIANTLRIDKLKSAPLFGLGTDDCHYYHGRPGSQPGRAWVMVRSEVLEAESLIKAMRRGDFYASSGVTLSEIQFDIESGKLSLAIDAQEGVEFTTRFVGTRGGYDETVADRLDSEGNVIRTTRSYSADVGQVFSEQTGHSPAYQLRGDELYVRAVVTSTRVHPNPSFENQFEQAWTQPVGWEARLK